MTDAAEPPYLVSPGCVPDDLCLGLCLGRLFEPSGNNCLAYAYEDWKTWLQPKFSNWTWPIETPLAYGDPISLASMVLSPLAKYINHHFQFFILVFSVF